MPRAKDISNQRFGRLTAIEPTDERRKGCVVWRCRCDCGNEKLVALVDLGKGVMSCGCLQSENARTLNERRGKIERRYGKDGDQSMMGRRFGRLVVKEFAGRNEKSLMLYLCECDCGNSVIATKVNLMNGSTKSCGCLRADRCKRDRTGRVFGHLTVVSRIGKHGRRNGFVLCECDCGRRIVKNFGDLVKYATEATACGRSHGKPRRANAANLAGKRFGRLLVMREEGSDGSGLLWRCLCECGNACVVGTKELRSGNTSSCGCGNDENRARNMRARSERIHVDGTNLAAIATGKIRPDNKTGVRGVYMTKGGKYIAHITFKGERHRLGTFDTLAEAAEARREAEQELFDPMLEAHGMEPTSEAECDEALRDAIEKDGS